MRPKRLMLALGFGALALVTFVILYQFGPPGIKAGEDRILSSMLLTNGNRLVVVTHRTGHPIDAYEVTLYRIDQKTNVFAYYLGHEEAFWWGCSLRASSATNKVQILAFWQPLAAYSIADDSVSWPGEKRPDTPPHKNDAANVVRHLAQSGK